MDGAAVAAATVAVAVAVAVGVAVESDVIDCSRCMNDLYCLGHHPVPSSVAAVECCAQRPMECAVVAVLMIVMNNHRAIGVVRCALVLLPYHHDPVQSDGTVGPTIQTSPWMMAGSFLVTVGLI